VLLAEIPLIFALIGLVLYTVLAGADFGAGLWQLTAGSGPHAERIRDHAYHAIAPVWEANHVWLIFVITVVWTAYPVVFGSIASTLTVPLFIAALGIILRGAAYALHASAAGSRDRRTIDTVFSLSSVLTPFALGTVIGGIASRRVPVGNAAGSPVSSWLNPTSIFLGILAVAVAAFLAAAYLAADAARLADPDLERRFRLRALSAGIITGAVALGGLLVVHADAPLLYQGLIGGPGLVGLVCSVLAGLVTLALVWLRRFGAARYTAALAVTAIIVGWALAQRPVVLPGLTIEDAAAPRDTLIAIVVAVLAGAILLFPALGLLFRLVLRGRFDPGSSAPQSDLMRSAGRRAGRSRLLARVAGACLVAGVGLLTVADAGWAHAVGVMCLLGAVVSGFLAAAPAAIADEQSGARRDELADV
jgi:cytochrome d ubiquinol oxidase subunit II